MLNNWNIMASRRWLVVALSAAVVLPLASGSAMAQDDEEDDGVIEEIITVGSQIRGAKITGALSVSVISAETIELMGIESGDELLDLIPENGQNFFNEAENISGGVNAARGDVGAFNLRSLGTGNTLVLLNGRRVVNAAGYQTEEVGGSFVPVNTANSNAIPVNGIKRVEVLRDGASAIYGADAVAGVVNTVLKTDYEGFSIRGRWSEYDNVPRSDQSLTLEWGKFFNGGATNIGVFANFLQRDRVNSQDDERWADADFRDRIPANSPWAGSTSFRNNSANSLYGQFDIVSSTSGDPFGLTALDFTDSGGEFETFPSGHEDCTYDISPTVCGDEDGNGTFRYNLNENRDLVSELERANVFVYLNHEFGNGMESFTEIGWYDSKTNLNRHPSATFSTVKLRVAADNYWNPLGPVGSPNRLPDSVIGTQVPVEGLELEIDNYRFTEVPRIVDNSGNVYRFLTGLRGQLGNWDWDSAISWSKAERHDVTHNRVSNILMQEALNDTTSAAYNPFTSAGNTNIERALVDVVRDNESELKMFDVKFSRYDLFEMPAGPVGMLAGLEYREESFIDDRDPRLDGTIVFTDWQGDTFPFVSDVVNSSPTPDGRGERDVTSLFTEFQVPLFETLDLQLAIRYEDFSDVGSTTVGKLAGGWTLTDQVLLRGSVSNAFRAPNLVTINEDIVARQNTRTDWACTYAADFGGDPDQDTIDCRNSTQRIAQGSEDLEPETSINTSIGVVFEPNENWTFTLDYWRIEKDDTIGLFGEENHTLLDLVERQVAGNGSCASFTGNPAVVREDPSTLSPEETAIYDAAGICPAGNIRFIEDSYANLNTRTVAGYDVGVYWIRETNFGDFNVRYLGSFLDEYEQEPGGVSAVLLAAQDEGVIPANYPVAGFDDLIRKDGNQKNRQSLSTSWRHNSWGASIVGHKVSDFYQDSLTLSDGTRYVVPSMTTWNATVDYTFNTPGDSDTRIRVGVKNLTDERAPLADRFFGYFADAHRDLGRSFYLDLRFRIQ